MRCHIKLMLSDREANALENALRVAREEFVKHAAESKAAKLPRLEEQFLSQSHDCSDLLVKLETVVELAGAQ